MASKGDVYLEVLTATENETAFGENDRQTLPVERERLPLAHQGESH